MQIIITIIIRRMMRIIMKRIGEKDGGMDGWREGKATRFRLRLWCKFSLMLFSFLYFIRPIRKRNGQRGG
jgi:hypothetical protein